MLHQGSQPPRPLFAVQIIEVARLVLHARSAVVSLHIKHYLFPRILNWPICHQTCVALAAIGRSAKAQARQGTRHVAYPGRAEPTLSFPFLVHTIHRACDSTSSHPSATLRFLVCVAASPLPGLRLPSLVDSLTLSSSQLSLVTTRSTKACFGSFSSNSRSSHHYKQSDDDEVSFSAVVH